MDSLQNFRERYLEELDRLGLDEDMCPYGGMASNSDDAVARFLNHLRSLAHGATWRDVFPELPAHWDLDDTESWTYPYRPMDTFDYQSLPTGPVCMAAFALASPDEELHILLADARIAGFQIHGAGYIVIQNPDWPDRPIRIVLNHSTTEAELFRFIAWLEARPDVSFDGVSRGVDER